MKKQHLLSLLLAAALLPTPRPALAQTTVKKVVLQGFWWDYTNANFQNKWADYLTELAPRLKRLGIDAVWIPPTPKNATGTNSVGYSPFDAYDLGDKFQKGTVRTRVGTKDEVLRLIAVLHANGIEVIQDVVLNHVDGAGGSNGAGGQDPNSYSTSANGGFKNFRYASFATPLPATGDNAAAYLAREGRWPKNYTNFHAHLGHNTTSGDLAGTFFGPDFCYGDDGGSDGYGPSSNATYNPTQTAGYSRNQARSWVTWMKKQTGIDGIRWDAVKNYAYAPQQDWLYNLKYVSGFANGGESMLSTGEYVGNKSELDTYVTSVNSRNGGTEFAMGTFDFSLRGAIYNMVAGGGNYNLSQLPGAQQDQRVAYYANSNTYVHRTAPFVNSHDTFRPQLNAAGNYIGWNTSQELGAHIEPNDVRLSAAYAINFAVDGNPHVFMEDLFNLAYTGRRFNHQPTDATALPMRSDLANIIWCHQHLNFKAGAYLVRHQSADHLVIERGSRALIGVNDNWNTWQNATVASNFAAGTVLKDYSGANGTATRTVGAGGQVSISTPPCDGTAAQGRRGYSVWAPVGQDGSTYNPTRSVRTTQEWELADDLGDSHCQSLGQGGRLPDNSAATRTAGKIFARAGQAVNYTLFAENNTTNTQQLTISLHDQLGASVSSATGTTSIAGTYTPAATGWLTLKARNATATQPGQRAYVQVNYQAPDSVDTRNALNSPQPTVALWTGAAGTSDIANCRNWDGGRLPSPVVNVRIPGGMTPQPIVTADYLFANNLTLDAGATLTVQTGATVQLFGNLTNNGTLAGGGTYFLTGISRTGQLLNGAGTLTFANLTVQNDSAHVVLGAPVTVRDTLRLTRGLLELGDHSLNMGTTVVLGASAASYVLTKNDPSTGGLCQSGRDATGTRLFPIGTVSGYSPLTSTTGMPTRARVYDGLVSFGASGTTPYAAASQFVQRGWVLSSGYGPNPFGVSVTAHWNAADEGPLFSRQQSASYINGTLGSMGQWRLFSMPTGPVTGSNPYQGTYTSLSDCHFAVGNATLTAARAATEPVLLTIFPNPTTGQVHLAKADAPGAVTLSLSSMLGQQLLPATTGSIVAIEAQLNAALTQAAPGIYLVTVRAGEQTQHLRLVRE